ncbi:hypothetical protein SS37A_39780 (plasmid) [Methylocystis iwaonis]|uniref:Uncharacterized protein n=1 Tax=Methylocystis iwaonis TaxID=2885079 RepID=A0ABN6VL03_9HYPH|nr:hypothetical protein SS37A_39780 [Methylocystis iwaonis]
MRSTRTSSFKKPTRGARSGSPLAGRTTAKLRRSPPNWNGLHKSAAPFKRNDAMLEALPIGVIVFLGSGIVENLTDKARKMWVPAWRFAKGGV